MLRSFPKRTGVILILSRLFINVDKEELMATKGNGREGMGWFSLAAFMLLFPALFFLCVYFPIWLGVASPY